MEDDSFDHLTDVDKVALTKLAIRTQRPISWQLAKWLLLRSQPEKVAGTPIPGGPPNKNQS